MNQLISSSASLFVLHSNVRSLAANHDKLTSLISHLTHNFHLLGISETKIIAGIDPAANVSVPGYNYISQPSNQNAGGVGFYIKSDCEFHSRDNVSISTADFETLSVCGLKSTVNPTEIRYMLGNL